MLLLILTPHPNRNQSNPSSNVKNANETKQLMPRLPKTARSGKDAKRLARRAAVARMVQAQQTQIPTGAEMRVRSRRREYWVEMGRGLCFEDQERKTMAMEARTTKLGLRHPDIHRFQRSQTLERRLHLRQLSILLLFLYMMTSDYSRASSSLGSLDCVCILGY
jgi:hypothetical protein